VAKVKIEHLAYLVPRDRSGEPPPLPKDAYKASVWIVDVVSGNLKPGERYDVYFGIPGTGWMMTPSRLKIRAEEYFVLAYVAQDGRRRLLGFPETEQEFHKWYREVFR
jgi:hypothetical protein